MKKGLTLALALLLVLALVPALTAQKKVTVWCWDPNFNGYSMKAAAAVYTKAHPDVTIDVVDIPENIEGKITAGLQAGGAGLPDIALFQDFRIEQFLTDYPKGFVDLKAAGVDYTKFAQYKVGPMTVGKAVYGIPFDTGSTGLWLRADYIKLAGLKPESYMKKMTWSEVIKLGEIVKAKTGKPLIAYETDSFDSPFRIMVQSAGGQFFDEKGSLAIRTDAVKKALLTIKEMSDKGLFYMAEGWSNWVNALNNDQSAGFLNAIWMVGTVKSKPENKGKWMVVPTPLLEGVKGAANASNNGGSSWYVFSASPNQKLAIDFLKSTWASSDKDALAFYNDILKACGAMGTFLPSQTGSNYTAKDEFFYNSQPVFKDFASWMAKVPVLRYTPNYQAMRTALFNAILKYLQGDIKTVDDTIAAAENEYKQTSGQ
jgi:lactose/L-arabinose transport system substrate-binding protein